MNGGEVIFTFDGNTKPLEEKTKDVSTSVGNIIKGSLASKAIAKGFQAITDNMDGAIKRFDTLNNFPNVMKNFGIGANDANEAIKYINKSIQGLPTTLDSAVSSVERFTSKNGDVKASARMFAAVNNAIIAGGAPIERQADALEQLSQAYAKGKPDMIEWKTLNEVMPAQLKQVAASMGMTTEQYGALLRDTKETNYTMDGFMDAVERLNTEGVDGFASFSEQAQGSVSGIGTAITNMKTAVTRGVANTIDEINKTLTSQGLPTISEIIQNATKQINNAFKMVQNIVSKIDFKTLFNALKVITPIVLSVTAGFKAYGLALKALKLAPKIAKFIEFGKAIASLIPEVKGVQGVMTLLSAAFNVKPIVIIIGAITALVAGFMYLWTTSKNFRNFWIGLWNGIVNIVTFVVSTIGNFFTVTIPKLFNSLITFIASVPEKILSFLEQIPYYIGYGIGAIADLIATFIVKTIPEFFTNLWAFITTKVPEIITGVINFVKTLPSNIWNILVSILTNVGVWLNNMRIKAKAGMEQVGKAIIDAVIHLPENMFNIGKNIVTGLWNGIKSAKDWLTKKVKNFAKGIGDGFKSVFKIGSPSKLTYGYGVYIDEGLANGIESKKEELQGIFDSMFDLSPNLYNNASANLSPNVNVYNDVNVSTDPLGQVVKQIKTYSGGSKNDYNYGMGV